MRSKKDTIHTKSERHILEAIQVRRGGKGGRRGKVGRGGKGRERDGLVFKFVQERERERPHPLLIGGILLVDITSCLVSGLTP